MRNSINIECTPGYPTPARTPMPGGTGVFVAGFGHASAAVDRKRIVTVTPAARVLTQINDLPYVASAPPPERRT